MPKETVISELSKSLLIAIKDLALGDDNIKDLIHISNSILDEFPKVKIDVIHKAIKNGSKGKYGKTFRFSTQDVCIWIREYQKELPPVYKGSFNG